MRKNAEVSPPDWGLEGRGGIEARKRLGYIVSCSHASCHCSLR
jgi:hypothetical protein